MSAPLNLDKLAAQVELDRKEGHPTMLAERLIRELREARAEAERQRERADHNAAAVNENADEIVRLRAEADELRRLLLDETYRPEGVEIVMRELNRVKAERDALRYQLSGGAS